VTARRASAGQLAAAVTDSALTLPYLIVAVCCAAIVVHATRTERALL
jgi:hypothetical protein